MRSEKEMFDLIIGVAESDERIRGVYMNGSKTNPNAPRDLFQDYDIVYIVTETASFIENENWISVFGERLYMQMPEKMDGMLGEETDWENYYGYLMQFADGNRIDLHVATLQYALPDISHDRLCRILLDKDGVLPEIPEATDEDHWVRKPTLEEYQSCCNEFWWILNSLGKGLWRKEIPYVMDMLNLHSRPQLLKMLSWYAGIRKDFTCSVGKSGKYLHRYLSAEEYGRLIRTYPKGKLEDIWQSVFVMCDLFDEMARKVGGELNYTYQEEEAKGSRLFLDCTYELPEDASEMMMVRKMRKGEAGEIVKIWLEGNLTAHSFIPEEYWKSHYEEVKKMLPEAEVYVYEDNEGIHGFAGIYNGYIEGIFVNKKMRGRGIGRALMRICKTKYFKLSLHVYCRNTGAVDFYMKEGFKVNKKQKDVNTGCFEYEMVWRKE